MRIAYVVHGIPPERRGGVEIQTERLAVEMARRGHEAAVLVVFPDPNREAGSVREEARSGVRIFRIARPQTRLRGTVDPGGEAVTEALRRTVDGIDPEVVHVEHLLNAGLGIVPHLAARPSALVVSVHDNWFWCHRVTMLLPDGGLCTGPSPEGCLRCAAHSSKEYRGRGRGDPSRSLEFRDRNYLAWRALDGAGAIVVPAAAVIEWFDEYGMPGLRSRTVVVPYSVLPVARSARAEGGRDRLFTVGFVGSIERHKGLHVLVEALRRTATPARLVVRGSGSEAYEREVRALSAGLDVLWGGPYEPDEVAQVMAGIDLVVLPAVGMETCPIVLLEARASGVPAVVSRTGGVPEAAGAGGTVVEPGDADGLARALERLADPAARAACADRIEPPLGPAEVADRHEAVYRDARGRRGR